MQYLIRKSYDPVTKFTDEMYYDDVDRKIHIVRTQDVEPVYRNNLKLVSENGKGFRKADGLYHKATIPNVIIEKWLTEGFNWYRSTPEERRKKLNAHPEFHVKRGKL